MTVLLSAITAVCEWLLGKLGAFFISLFSQFVAKEKVKQQAEDDAAKLASAKTQQEKIDAANAINRDTFS